MITFHASQEGLMIYRDGKLVAVIEPDGFPELLFQVTKAHREAAHAYYAKPVSKSRLRTVSEYLWILGWKVWRAARVDRTGRGCRSRKVGK